MDSKLTQEFLLSAIRPLGIVLLMGPSFAGVSIGMSKASQGICQSATVKNDIVLTIVPAAFIGVGILYAGLVFFLNPPIGTPPGFGKALLWFAGNVVTGLGIFWGAIGLGDISSVATITTAQQKRFKMSFFLLMVFGEFVLLFSLIVGLMLSLQNSWSGTPFP